MERYFSDCHYKTKDFWLPLLFSFTSVKLYYKKGIFQRVCIGQNHNLNNYTYAK